ncbi:Atxe2 family lasso peptide isopeptidase [Stenotrophomonas sp. PS02297]|uniref:Atxe2 family lasso peptide isopeptidase n=1 Tax=Stenotrophomonas sp. PS02297 TaxID=2991423 RepID=UPI00249A229E|nr:Atxe2 family lasso peptide isopeptidase [Stenotrophomonas sp. PS02297]
MESAAMAVLTIRAGRVLASCLMGLVFVGGLGAQVISPRQLVEVADVDELVVSPGGDMVAFRVAQASVERNTYDSTWYVQRMDGTTLARRVGEGGHLLRESDGASLAPAGVLWSPDGRYLYYRALLDGRIAVWRAAVDGSDARVMTRDPADVRSFRLSPDGQLLRYGTGATREQTGDAEWEEYDSGIHIDETIPLGQGIFQSGYLDERRSTQRLFGSDVIRSPLLARVPEHWREIDLATGRMREIPAPEPSPAPLPAALSERFKPWRQVRQEGTGRIAMLTHVAEWSGAGPKPDVELSVFVEGNGGGHLRCRAELCTDKPITGIQWRPGREEILFTLTDPEDSQAQSILRWDIKADRVFSLVHTPGLINGGRATPNACGASSEALVCVAADASHPPRLERIDLESGNRTVLFNPNAALAADMEGVPVRRLHWTDVAGRRFNGLYFPAQRTAGGAPPLFLTYYRCPGFVRGGVGDEWPLVTLAGRGISALCINAPPSELDAVTRFELGRSAIESVIDLLAASGEIDRGKVGMGGLSYGTEVTMWMAMNSDALSAASVSSIAFSPLAYTLMSMSGETFFSRLRTYWQLGAPDETPAQWKRLSPAFNLDRIKVPMLMQLPEQEYQHTLDYAVPLIRDQRADLYVYPNEAHQKFQPRHKLAAYERNVDWFRFWLQGFEDTEAAKVRQYARWRTMADRHAGHSGHAARIP